MTTQTRRGRKPSAEPRRRARGTGTIRQRGSTYTACWFTIDPATGKRQQQSKGGFGSMAEAQKHLNIVLAEVQRGTYVRDQALTVERLLTEFWLPVKASEGTKENTVAYHEWMAKTIIARMGGVRVNALTPLTVANVVDKMTREGLSARTRQATVGTLKAATAWAARSKPPLIPFDPLADYSRPRLKGKGAPKGIQAWNVEQARQFIASVADDRYAACWALTIARGLRRGELAGLKWSSIDLDARHLIVRESRVVIGHPGGRTRVKTDTPKSGEARQIPLDDLLITRLRDLRAAQDAEAEIAAEAYEHQGFVMARALGGPVKPGWITRRFDALVTKANLPRLTVHGLRHTAATCMLADGATAKVVAEILGDSVEVVMAFYSHVLPGMSEQAGERLSSAILG